MAPAQTDQIDPRPRGARRVALPLVGGYVGYLATGGGPTCNLADCLNGAGALVGAPLGVAAAMVIDWTVLSVKDTPTHWTPTVVVHAGATTLGIAGTF